MSAANGFPGPQSGRGGAPTSKQWSQPQAQHGGGANPNHGYAEPAFAPQPGAPSFGHGAHGGQGGYGAPQSNTYGESYGQAGQFAGNGGASYAPQFEPYAAPAPRTPPAYQPPVHQPNAFQPAAPAYGQPSPYGQGYEPQSSYAPHGAQPAAQWPQPGQADNRGYDLNGYQPQSQRAPAHPQHDLGGEHLQQDWAQANADYGYQGQQDGYADPHGQHGSSDIGFAQQAGGELDQGYAEDEDDVYETEEPRRFGRSMTMMAALVGAIVVGGGLAYSYKAVFGDPTKGDPPVIKSAGEPAKMKPADGGGKQFAHTDSKIMGRLGEGAGVTAATAAGDAQAGDADPNGTRKVSTLVVGRDGSIQAPAAEAAAEPADSGAGVVPGMTVVDGLGPQRAPAAAATIAAVTPPPPKAEPAAAPASQKIVVSAPPSSPQKPAVIARAEPADTSPEPSTGSIDPDVSVPTAAPAKAAAKKAVTKTAALAPSGSAGVPAAPVTSGNGFVAVLASVPRSTSSRMDALKRFADMQQKYGAVLNGKTPDVAEANLGAKGSYHRLIVGPPGSREQASTVCTQLKSQGYGDCWVTSY
ncbi:MAG: SPOR domain-containing protein [Hyphomicrobium sp.]